MYERTHTRRELCSEGSQAGGLERCSLAVRRPSLPARAAKMKLRTLDVGHRAKESPSRSQASERLAVAGKIHVFSDNIPPESVYP